MMTRSWPSSPIPAATRIWHSRVGNSAIGARFHQKMSRSGSGADLWRPRRRGCGAGYGRCPANVAGLRPFPGRELSPSDGARGRVSTAKARTGPSWRWRCRLRRGVGKRHRSEDAQRGICNSGIGSARGDRRRARLEHGRRPARPAALSQRRGPPPRGRDGTASRVEGRFSRPAVCTTLRRG